jgi:hypothetical protein
VARADAEDSEEEEEEEDAEAEAAAAWWLSMLRARFTNVRSVRWLPAPYTDWRARHDSGQWLSVQSTVRPVASTSFPRRLQ